MLQALLSRLSSEYSALPTEQWRGERKPFRGGTPWAQSTPTLESLAQHRQVAWEPGPLPISPPQLQRSAPQPEDHAPSTARVLMAPQALVHGEFDSLTGSSVRHFRVMGAFDEWTNFTLFNN